MKLTSLVACFVAWVQAADVQQPTVQAAPASPAGEHLIMAGVLERLAAAERLADEDPHQGAPELATALAELALHADALATDSQLQEQRLIGQLTLARALLAIEDLAGAQQVIDEVVRTARGEAIPANSFGPRIGALYEQRSRELSFGQRAGLDIRCAVPCRVYINERSADSHEVSLPPGAYRVHVEPVDPRTATPWRTGVYVRDHVVQLRYPQFTDTPLKPPARPSPSTTVDMPRRRMLPRWLEIAGVSVGAASVGVGAGLWAIDYTCKGPESPLCRELWDTDVVGATLVSAGVALLVSAVTTLAVDEVASKRDRTKRDRTKRGTQRGITLTRP